MTKKRRKIALRPTLAQTLFPTTLGYEIKLERRWDPGNGTAVQADALVVKLACIPKSASDHFRSQSKFFIAIVDNGCVGWFEESELRTTRVSY